MRKTILCLLALIIGTGGFLSAAVAEEEIFIAVDYTQPTNRLISGWQFPYSDEWFSRPAEEFNREMAKGSLGLTVSAFGNLGQTNYGAAKAGVIGYTKCLAREAARYNITVNCVAPSYVNTEMLRAVPDEVMQRFLNAIPLGRLGEPDELAAAVAFLCSDDSSFVTGECLVVSGGSYM